MKKEVFKKVMFLVAIGVFVFALASGVLAYERLCLTYGQSVPSAQNPRYTCDSTRCFVCVNDNLNPVNPNSCRDISGCSIFEGGGTVDAEPPAFNISSPVEGEVYNERTVLFDLISNEPTSFYYLDNVNGRGRERRLVSLSRTFSRYISLKDGLNDITFRGVDRNRNEFEQTVTFFVDSKEPQISRTYPQRDFANGIFSIEFSEENPVSLILHYGNSGVGFKTAEGDLNSCNSARNRMYCDVEVDLINYDGEEIMYWFTLTDRADNVDESRPINLFVDDSDPVIVENSLEIIQDGRYLMFSLEVVEDFLDEVFYRYEDNGRVIEKRICNSLDNGLCEGRASFRDGEYEIEIVARDTAGNEDMIETEFFVDSKAPRIGSTEPRRGFASGLFYVEFDEENPVDLTLNYGNDKSGFKTSEVDLNECFEDRRGFSCEHSVDLTDYDGEEIEYWFEIIDRVGSIDESRSNFVDVDITPPEVLNLDSFWTQGEGRNERYIYFDFEIDEENFEEITYIDNSDSRPRERRICSRLRDDRCTKRVSFRSGHHQLDIYVLDEAGNAISSEELSVEFDV